MDPLPAPPHSSPSAPSTSGRQADGWPVLAPTPLDGAHAPGAEAPLAEMPSSACTTQVMFDGSCPLCRAEVALYQRQALEAGAALQWVDVSGPYVPLAPEPDVQALRRRFHVRTAQGQWLSGAAAFVHLWAQLPRWRLLAAAARLPGVTALMEGAYRVFLLLRPGLQATVRWASRLRGRTTRR
jgi:predicted DCC family thiol-disulfide oxidoreductase YuxK